MKKFLIVIFLTFVVASCNRPNRNPDNLNSIDTDVTMDKRSSRKATSAARSAVSNEVRMSKKGGVYEIPIEINGVGLDIIFDTGASNISISVTEVLFLLKQGKLTEEDFLGSMQFRDATGRISEGTILNLRTVKIGNKIIKNVEASVVHNMDAPLLLGQSALAQFGKVTIDYKKNILSFE